jgi:hypothetical protein
MDLVLARCLRGRVMLGHGANGMGWIGACRNLALVFATHGTVAE